MWKQNNTHTHTHTARRLVKEYLNNYCCSVDELWWSTGVKFKVLGVLVVPLVIATVSPDCHRSTLGDTGGQGTALFSSMQLPEPCSLANSEAILLLNEWFILCKNLRLSEEDGKWCLQGLSACGQQEDMIIEWLRHTFLNIQCETGRYGAREGRQWSRTVKMWQNQGTCEKGGNQAVGGYLGHTGFFLIARTICSMSATSDVQLLLFSWVTRLQWNDAVTPYAEHAIILPKQRSDHSASLTSSLANPPVFVVFSWIL